MLLTSLARDGAHEVVLRDLPEHHEDVLVGAHVRCEHHRRRADQNQPIRRQVLKLAFASKVHADTRSEGALDDRLDHFGPRNHRNRDGEVVELIGDRSAAAAPFATILGFFGLTLSYCDELGSAGAVGATVLASFLVGAVGSILVGGHDVDLSAQCAFWKQKQNEQACVPEVISSQSHV